MLELKKVLKKFGNLTGPNGAGKTTTIRMIMNIFGRGLAGILQYVIWITVAMIIARALGPGAGEIVRCVGILLTGKRRSLREILRWIRWGALTLPV